MDADRLPFHQHRFERLDAQAVKGGCPVQQHGMILDDVFQDLIHPRVITAFNDLLGPLHRLGFAAPLELVDDERAKQLDRHHLGQAALVEPELRPNHDHRPPRVVDALAQQVLAEPALLTFQHVG